MRRGMHDSEMIQNKILSSVDILPVNRELLAYWLGKLEGRAMPPKGAIDPTEMPKLLHALVIYERLTRTHFKIRLAGTEVVRRLGVDPTGSNVLDLLAPTSRDMVQSALNRILDQPCGHYSRVRDRYPSGREAVVEVLRLPLLSEGGEARFIISSTVELPDRSGWGDPQEKPSLLAQLIDQSFFTWPVGSAATAAATA